MLSEADMGYQIADCQPTSGSRAPRSMAFPEGVSSHTRVAVPDPIESKQMKIASMDQHPGIKVAAPEASRGIKVARPSGMSVTGDFRQTIRVSGGDSTARRNIGLKLYGSSINPTLKVHGNRR